MKVWIDDDQGSVLVFSTAAECDAVYRSVGVPDEVAKRWLATTQAFLAMQAELARLDQ